MSDTIPRTPKTAGVTIYLMEELGDARLRCDQLNRYIAEAVKLINQSEHKDHFIEVAGHLLQGIPETAFKLQKALQAVALAADRLDYEELKLELRPEKVEELEQVLKEVRLHQVHHRSETPMTPQQVSAQLRALAKTARAEGYLPIHEIAALVRSLDSSRVAGSTLDAADTLEKIAGTLDSSSDSVSPVQLASLLARVAMETDFAEAARGAPSGQKLAGFLSTKETLTLNFDEIRALSNKALQAAKSERWKPALHSIYFLVDTIGTLLVNMGSMDTTKVEALKREIRELLPKAEGNMSEVPSLVTAADNRLERLVSGIEDQAKAMRHALDTYNKDPGKYAPQLKNLKEAAWAIASSLRTLERTLAQSDRGVIALVQTTVTDLADQLSRDLTGPKDAHDFVVAAFENASKNKSLLARANDLLAKTAAPILWMYTDEEGKDFYLTTRRRGALRSPYTGKSFTAEAKRATLGDVGKELKADEVKVKGTLWKYTDDEGNEVYLPERVTTALRSPTTGKTFKAKAERFTLSEVGKDLRDKKASDEETKRSRFEEGVSADPTKNMDPDDAEEWKSNTDKYEDKFKAASTPVDILAWKA